MMRLLAHLVRAPLPAAKNSRRGMRLAPERGLRGRESGDRDAERRARDVVEMNGLAERDRGGIATVLAADANLEVRSDRAATLGGDLDEFSDANGIERHERVGGQQPLRGVDAEEGGDVVARDAQRRLGEV